MTLKVAFHTLGCKVNYYETEALKGKFREGGFEIVDFQDLADVYVVNTCTVTHQADRKSRQVIRRAKRRNPAALVAVIGCYAEVNPKDISSLPEADIILGTQNRLSLPELIKRKITGDDTALTVRTVGEKREFEDMPWMPEQGRARAFLKIQDGCDQGCSYCIVPMARGPVRSLPREKGIEYLKEISSHGYEEVVLSGIHLGVYGRDLKPGADLSSFLEKAVMVKGIKRIRLSSIEPTDFDDKLIKVIASNEKICRHLHIPLQSGDNSILKTMGRPYNTKFYSGLLNSLRELLPDLAVSTDIMVGFPGEGNEHFLSSFIFVKSCAFSRLHVFKFSPRSGTKAEGMDAQVAPEIKDDRSGKMIALGEELSSIYQEKFPGRELSVLFEKVLDEGMLEGLTSNYLRVRAYGPESLRGQIGKVLIKESCDGYLKGSL
ncbi:MAG: tRNA (N(6)-L-threonylcarbamoyladenosine(37)-C(2))-methylthiotransferase MtaB [Bacillota bacterium]|nr:tRNA (N(6)-L-threonylcarbamoyladenosine(37)-C(2))-methylthiotransferase MtaB [Bacillota bacterium]